MASRIPLAAAAHSAPVTHLAARVGLTLLVLAMLAGVYLLMWRTWRRRVVRQAAVMTVAPLTAGDDILAIPWHLDADHAPAAGRQTRRTP
jgi:hypothetical protein